MLSSFNIERRRRPPGNRFRAAVAAAAMTVAASGPTPALAKAERIVSMNLCTDQLVMLLADRERIASVSFLAADEQVSALANEAAGLKANHGLSEEILPLNPDLVLAGAFSMRPTVALLRKLGYRVVDLPIANNLDDIRTNIRRVAEAIGEPRRAEELIAVFDARLAALPPAAEWRRPLAALYWANGLTSGEGTLAGAIVMAAGLRNLAIELGLSGTGQLPLETLLAASPDVLILGQARLESTLADENFRHPALVRSFARRPQMRIAEKYWICGSPLVATAIERLAAFRETSRNRALTGPGAIATPRP